MPGDLIEVKPSVPGLPWIRINVRELFRRLRGDPPPSEVRVVADRFLAVFEQHGVKVTQIPHFLPEVSLERLASRESVLSGLSGEVLDKTADLFNVTREWLDGVSDYMYRPLTCYKHADRLFEQLAALKIEKSDVPVRMVYSASRADVRKRRPQQLILFLAEYIRHLGDQQIMRYHVFGDAWDWAHPPCRIQLKAMARVLHQVLDLAIPMYHITSDILQAVGDGSRVPMTGIRRSLLTEPSLEDYGLGASESGKAKETEELDWVKHYIEEHGLMDMATQTKGAWSAGHPGR